MQKKWAKEMQLMNSSQHLKAFSVIELSVIISALAVFTFFFLNLISSDSEINSQNLTSTEEKIKKIDRHILEFIVVNKKLPCPADVSLNQEDSKFGYQNLEISEVSGINCLNNFGAVPVYELGLDESYFYDDFGHKIIYAVSEDLCGSSLDKYKGCSAIDFKSPSISSIEVNSRDVAYLLLSNGINGAGGYLYNGRVDDGDIDEQENMDQDNEYVTNDSIDDIIIYNTKEEIESYINISYNKVFSNIECSQIIDFIDNIDASEIAMLDQIDGYEIDSRSKGGEMVLRLFWYAQRICDTEYDIEKKCPGDGVLNQQDYCECSSGNWNAC